MLEKLDRGETKGIDRLLILEGRTSADCLIECEQAVIWIEGKRNDWLDYSTSWDVTRDQLARNTEAAWLYATPLGKDFCLVICHEHQLKHHEELLIGGYRRGTWAGGWPHLTPSERKMLGSRIGTVTWESLAGEWSPLGRVLRWVSSGCNCARRRQFERRFECGSVRASLVRGAKPRDSWPGPRA
jgi:hypothetical protein